MFTSKAFRDSKGWEDFQTTCSHYLPMPLIGRIIKVIYHQMKNSESPFWEIDEKFVEDLGFQFIVMETDLFMIENKDTINDYIASKKHNENSKSTGSENH